MVEDVSDKYIECPECKVPIACGKVANKTHHEFKIFGKDEFKLVWWDYQCPKCFKIWRNA